MIFYLNIIILIFSIISLVGSQQLGIVQTNQFVKPTDCNNQTQYFDIARLQCLNCPENSFPFDCKPKDYIIKRTFILKFFLIIYSIQL
jgi:hypothetical protein